jgi:tRNA(fMet)-specific endonuclease VapC
LIHLDTNVAIALLNESSKRIRERFESGASRGYSAVSLALFIVAGRLTLLPFEEADAREAADIRAHLRRLATPIGPYDVLIAAQARRAGAPLVTANSREFERVPGLIVTDWAA